jgi:hypothetical protein
MVSKLLNMDSLLLAACWLAACVRQPAASQQALLYLGKDRVEEVVYYCRLV